MNKIKMFVSVLCLGLFGNCLLFPSDAIDNESIAVPLSQQFARALFIEKCHEKVEEVLAKEKYYRSLGYGMNVPKLCEASYGVSLPSPLAFASIYQNQPMMQILLNYGANVNGQDARGCTALMDTIVFDCGNEFDLLVNYGAYLNHQDNKGVTPLMKAVQSDNPIFLEKLLSLKVNLNIQDEKGQTALHYAAGIERVSDWQMMDMLLKHPQINLNICDNKGQTPAHIAVVIGTTILSKLKACGAKFDIPDLRGKTALDYAIPMQRDIILHQNF